MRGKIALWSMLLILLAINWSVKGKEKHLAEGVIVYLNLAPIDPRSIMQGDYMALRFGISAQVYQALPKAQTYQRRRHNAEGSDGYVVVELDENSVGIYKRLHQAEQVLASNEMLLRYRVRNGAVKFATNAFFFQEGMGEIYQPARYGQFRVDPDGELLLAAMYDQDLKLLQPEVVNQ